MNMKQLRWAGGRAAPRLAWQCAQKDGCARRTGAHARPKPTSSQESATILTWWYQTGNGKYSLFNLKNSIFCQFCARWLQMLQNVLIWLSKKSASKITKKSFVYVSHYSIFLPSTGSDSSLSQKRPKSLYSDVELFLFNKTMKSWMREPSERYENHCHFIKWKEWGTPFHEKKWRTTKPTIIYSTVYERRETKERNLLVI